MSVARGLVISLWLAGSMVFALAADGTWLAKVPTRARARVNPVAKDSNAAAAGAKLYRQNCASCHGAKAEGHRSKPSLHSERVREATDGEIFWLLTNGGLAKGMPSWSRLPEGQRWDLVSYLRTLDAR